MSKKQLVCTFVGAVLVGAMVLFVLPVEQAPWSLLGALVGGFVGGVLGA